jgi:hypothetical protein
VLLGGDGARRPVLCTFPPEKEARTAAAGAVSECRGTPCCRLAANHRTGRRTTPEPRNQTKERGRTLVSSSTCTEPASELRPSTEADSRPSAAGFPPRLRSMFSATLAMSGPVERHPSTASQRGADAAGYLGRRYSREKVFPFSRIRSAVSEVPSRRGGSAAEQSVSRPAASRESEGMEERWGARSNFGSFMPSGRTNARIAFSPRSPPAAAGAAAGASPNSRAAARDTASVWPLPRCHNNLVWLSWPRPGAAWSSRSCRFREAPRGLEAGV